MASATLAANVSAARNVSAAVEAALAGNPPSWIPNEAETACMVCDAPFTLLNRRHHCRHCGRLVCSDCSPGTHALPHFGYVGLVRVCSDCAKVL
ncbi:MAG: hypothetical protein EOO65_00490 [Methanosarcinales archaeon]|nr:MAG: hypothetical protein EOO65_00490 [Methanosarcinales archaeon]